MTIEIKMPALSPTMTDGVLAKWMIKNGDKIKPGMVIAEIETDKASMEVEAVDGGIMGRILVEGGTQNVAVGTVIGLMLEAGEDESVLNSYATKVVATVVEEPKKQVQVEAKFNVSQSNNDRIFASPLAKIIAENNGVDLSKIAGTGPNGRIVKHDIENIKQEVSVSHKMVFNQESTSIPHTKMRRVIAARLTESKQQSPHFYLNIECNMSALLDMRKKMNESYNRQKGEQIANISVNDLFVKASAVALRSNLDMNVSWQENEIIMHGNIDVCIAVAIPGGLITPIIKNADQLGLLELSHAAKGLIKKARDGKLMPEEFQGGTFSVSNLGMYGIKEFYPIINPPQAAILSIGATEKKPVVNGNGELDIGDICTIGLSVDHRAIDGAVAAKYLQFLKTIIENPVMLSL
jgi:pyruvate dehydrogenase E2 component (dihydrolipoamide acetyltransferase)